MTRLEQARVRRAKQRATQDALQGTLDVLIGRLPLQPSEVFLSIIEYGIEGLAAQNALHSHAGLSRMVESLCVKHGLR